MRRIPAVFSVLSLSALALVGCASAQPGDAAGCERPVSDSTVLDVIDASGELGQPTVSLGAPVHVDDTVFTDLTVGEGAAVTTRAQDVQFTVAIANGSSGETIIASGTQVTPLSNWAEHYEGIAVMLECATEGSRVVGAIPASDLSETAAADLGLTEGDAAAIVIDLQRVYLPAANGAPQYNDRPGMPSVVLDPSGRPGIIVPDADAPTEQVVEVLKKGDGAEVTAADSVRVHYTAVGWDDRTVVASTWTDGASAAVTLAGDGPEFAAALEGQTVGSQLLVVVPAADDAASATVYVVDILGTDLVATQ